MQSDHLGLHVRHWRLKRGISQRTLAGLAGFSQGYISQIEAGVVSVDKRSTQVALAAALQVSIADLTGQPYDPQTLEHSTATAAIPELRAALLGLGLDDTDSCGDANGDLDQAIERAQQLHNDCRYDVLVPLLPGLLAACHRQSVSPSAQGSLVWSLYAATFAAKYLGYADLAMLAAQQCHLRGSGSGDAAWRAVGEFALLHALPHEAGGVADRRIGRVIDSFESHAADVRVAQVYGMLHLTAAMRSAVAGRAERAYAHLGEADRLAARTGEANFAQMWFGPTNAAIWRVGVYAELQEGGRARPLGRLDVTALGRNRRATYFADLGRAFAQTRGHDDEAMIALLKAEAIAPQRVRLAPAVRETVGAMLRRARAKAGGPDLQALARRLGTFD